MKLTFISAEHKSLDEELIFPGLPNDQKKFLMPNGMQLSFGEIIALSGDFYGVAKLPICLGKDDQERKERFLNAYATLAYSKRKKEMKVLKLIDEQMDAIKKAMSEGKPESVGLEQDAIKEIVKILRYTKFEIIDLYEMALDHMDNNAILAHHTGHQLAMEVAAKAHYLMDEGQRLQQLAYAYTLEAFACHFLTDLFASGHLRVPTSALFFEFGPAISSLLITFMHNEDNYAGLNVINDNGDAWKAYGDAHLFETDNQTTRRTAIQALKLIINEVHNAFLTGNLPNNDYSQAYKLLPKPTLENFSPMFSNDLANNCLLYRKKLKDMNCNEYKKLTHSNVLYVLTKLSINYLKNYLRTKEYGLKEAYKQLNNKVKHNKDHVKFTIFNSSEKKESINEDAHSLFNLKVK